MTDARAGEATEDDVVEELDGEPMPDAGETGWLPTVADSEPAVTAPSEGSRAAVPTGPMRPLQTVAVAAGGFLAGAAVLGLVRRRRLRRALGGRRFRRRRGANAGPLGELVHIVGSRSVLVDVHLLRGRD